MPIQRICQRINCGKIFFVPPARMRKHGAKYCSWWCAGRKKPLIERFWDKVRICDHGIACPYCCHIWTAALTGHGYGIIAANQKDGKRSKNILAHHLGWEILNNQPFPYPLWGLHHCDVKACVSGFHIYPGTVLDNAADAKSRNRLSRTHNPSGDLHPRAKLCSQDIPRIFQLRALGMKQQTIANLLHVSQHTIWSVLARKAWRHISQNL